MNEPACPPDPARASAWLADAIAARVDGGAAAWLHEQLAKIALGASDAALSLALGRAPRMLGKADLAPAPELVERARALRPCFDASAWSVDQAARVLFVLASWDGDAAAFARRLDRLADTAEVNESVAIHLGFALYPPARMLEPRARRAVRSGIRPVFEAIAHRNPYPGDVFDEAAWNQMIVKTFFLDSALWPVQGLERRANPALTRMLVDLARERRAAGRRVGPQLWRCVRPEHEPAAADALAQAWRAGSRVDRLAICKSLAGSTAPAAQALLAEGGRCGLVARAAAIEWPALEASTPDFPLAPSTGDRSHAEN